MFENLLVQLRRAVRRLRRRLGRGGGDAADARLPVRVAVRLHARVRRVRRARRARALRALQRALLQRVHAARARAPPAGTRPALGTRPRPPIVDINNNSPYTRCRPRRPVSTNSQQRRTYYYCAQASALPIPSLR